MPIENANLSPEDNVFSFPVFEEAVVLHGGDQIVTLDTGLLTQLCITEIKGGRVTADVISSEYGSFPHFMQFTVQ